MVNGLGPGLYSDIGKEIRDLLYKDFQEDQKFALTGGITFYKYGSSDSFLAGLKTQVKIENITTDIKVDTDSRLFATITADQPAPGLKAIVNFIAPDQNSGKVKLQYQHDNVGISTSIGLTRNPIVNFSGVVGEQFLSFGADVSFDIATQKLTKFNAGYRVINDNRITSLTLIDKGNTLKYSMYYVVNPRTYAAIGCDISVNIQPDTMAAKVGGQLAWNPLTMVKACVSTCGNAGVMVQHEFQPKSLFTISGEFNVRDIEKGYRIGLALALKP